MPEPTPAPTPAPSPAPASWFEGSSPEDVAHIQNKGWDKLDAAAVPKAIYESYRNAERVLGVPSERLMKLPEQTDSEGWRSVWQKLGAGKEASEYDLSAVEGIPDHVATAIRNASAARGVTKEAAVELAKTVTAALKTQETEAASAQAAKLAEQTAALKANWGGNFDANMFVAKNAAQKLGVEPDVVDAMERSLGYDKVMEFFRQVGEKTGEDTFKGGGDMPTGLKTVEQVKEEKRALYSDPEFVAKFNRGDTAAIARMAEIDKVIAAERTNRGY